MKGDAVFLARRNLLQNKTRFGLSVASVSLAVMLILLLSGLRSGVYRQVGRYLEHTPGSVVVAQEGVTNLSTATSLLPSETVDVVRQLEGASGVVPILSQFVIVELHDRKQPVYLVGYDASLGGGPWSLTEGREPRADDEAVLDRVLASRHDMRVGDRFDLQGRTFTIVGLSSGTSSFTGSYLFIQKSAAEVLLSAPGASSFLLVTPASGTSEQVLLDRLRNVPGTTALRKQEMIANDRQLIANVFNAPLLLMVAIAFLVGTLVVALVIYTATVERQREFGVLKAIGAESSTSAALFWMNR